MGPKTYLIIDTDYQRARKNQATLQQFLPECELIIAGQAEEAPEDAVVFAPDTLDAELARPTVIILQADSPQPVAGDGEWLPDAANGPVLRLIIERARERGLRRLNQYVNQDTEEMSRDRHGTLTTVTRSIMHEFNNHHAVVLSSLERLRLQGPLTDKQEDTVKRGIEAIDRATAWIRRLRRNLPPHSVQLAQFNPVEFLRKFFTNYQPDLIDLVPDGPMDMRIRCDPRDLTSILQTVSQALATQHSPIKGIGLEPSLDNTDLAICLECPNAKLEKSNAEPTIDLLIPEILAGRNRGSINYRHDEIVINLPISR